MQEEGWPLGLQPLNVRVGLMRDVDFPGSASFSTLLTAASPSSSFDSFSDLDSESIGSFYNEKSITLGSLIGISSILELSRRPERRRAIERLRNKKTHKSRAWFFSLCSKLSMENVSINDTPSLAQFLEAERLAANASRRNQTPTNDSHLFSVLPVSIRRPRFMHGAVNPGIAEVGRSRFKAVMNHANGYGIPISPLLSCLCGQITN
ncbi:hypothetical protein RJ641_028329 [Dillenia turbinata]|uniref:Uncharacterized protein n=1 Tax=Dillenia turbinata TaxID=194707 RepID=A0AAN8W796_9MAGN